MFRNRFLILLGTCFLAATAAWADDVGYVDCSSHSEGAQVFGKPRKTPDVVAALPCGERFTVLVYGFVFSQIQTRDGKVGYIYSNIIAVDRNATSVQQTGSLQVASARTTIPSAPAPVVKPNPPAPTQPQPVAALPQPQPQPQLQPAPTKVIEPAPPAPSVPEAGAAEQPAASRLVRPQPVSAPVAPVSASVPAPNVPEPVSTVVQPTPPASEQPQPTPAQPTSTQQTAYRPTAVLLTPVQPASAPAPASASSVAETAAPVSQPDPPAAAQPQPAAAEPPAPAIRPAVERSSWEQPRRAVRKPALFEFYGGYAFVRVPGSGGGTSTNLNGAMGSVGLNMTSWLQIVADSTYNYVTATGTKNVLYGNHFGARYFHRSRSRWAATPFFEALVGGSRAYKAGG
jgi:hypothetical protein